jgi:hypothetical protein
MKPDLVTTGQWLKYNYYFVLEHIMGVKNSEKYLRKKKEELFRETMENKGMKDRGQTIDVKTIERFSFDQYKEHKDELLTTPLVFRGAAKDWKSTKVWSKDFFREQYGKTKVTIIDNPGLVDKEKENVFKHTDFGSYFDEVEKDQSKYLRFSRVLDHNPELLNDLDLEWLRQFKYGMCNGEQTFLFMGEGGTKTPMHAGLTHTIFIQVKGRKKWTICTPNERFFLDPVADRVLYFYTHANPLDCNDPKFPMVPFVKKYELILEEGDVLWLPSLFWHYVENLTPTIGVAFKYTNLPQSFKITKMLFSLFFLATKPTILRSFIYNRKNKQDYVFNSKSAKFH